MHCHVVSLVALDQILRLLLRGADGIGLHPGCLVGGSFCEFSKNSVGYVIVVPRTFAKDVRV